MPLLLDTQIIIWLEERPSNLTDRIKDKISSESEVYFSKASVWEIVIKIKTSKLKLKLPIDEFFANFHTDYNVQLLDVALEHIYHTLQLPLHHRVPFDRLLIAQSIVEKIDIVSSDVMFDKYDIKRRW